MRNVSYVPIGYARFSWETGAQGTAGPHTYFAIFRTYMW